MTTQTTTSRAAEQTYSIELPGPPGVLPFPKDVPTVPLLVIEWEKLDDPEERKRLVEACTTTGFFYLHKTPVDPAPMFELADEVFALPMDEKMKYDMGTTGNYFGYKKQGAMTYDADGTPDLIEFMNISKDDALQQSPQPLAQPEPVAKNMHKIREYTEASHTVVRKILEVLSIELGLEPDFLGKLHDKAQLSGDQTRFARSPPVPKGAKVKDDQTLGAHTDYGSVTVLHNRLGGLQVRPDGVTWAYVRPLKDCAVINLGDAIAKMTGNFLKSSLHRVVSPPGVQASTPRTSVVYFSRPANDVLLAPVPSKYVKVDDQGPYPSAGEWIARRARNMMVANHKGEETFKAGRGTEATDVGR